MCSDIIAKPLWPHLPGVTSLEINPLFPFSKTRAKINELQSITDLQSYANLAASFGTNASDGGKLAIFLCFSSFQTSVREVHIYL